MRRLHLFAVLLIAAGALPAMPVAAKEGVRAKLDRPVRLDRPPGRTVQVAWHLTDQQGRPFGASGIYLRVSRCGRRPLRIPASAQGRGGYSARVRVPQGGIRKLVVGLRGWRIIGGRRERADAFFQFDPPLYRHCP
jgi:hypothetical protein